MPIVFVAVALPAETTAQVTELMNRLSERVTASEPAAQLRIGWTAPEKLHLTLQYLANIAEESIPAAREAVEEVALRTKSFQIEWDACGGFPPQGDLQTLWLGVQDREEQLHELASSLALALAARGFLLEERKFIPHLTLARVRRGSFPRAILGERADTAAGGFSVTELTLFESRRQRSGSVYRVLSRHRLRTMA